MWDSFISHGRMLQYLTQQLFARHLSTQELSDLLQLYNVILKDVTEITQSGSRLSDSELMDVLDQLGDDRSDFYHFLVKAENLMSDRPMGTQFEEALSLAEDTVDALHKRLNQLYDELIPHVADQLEMSVSQLKSQSEGLFYRPSTIEPWVDGETSFEGQKFKITINTKLTAFIWEMVKLWTTTFAMGDADLKVIEESKFTIEQTASMARKLATTYFDEEKISFPKVVAQEDLSLYQQLLAAPLLAGGERFVIAHELAHAMLWLAPEKFSDMSDSCRSHVRYYIENFEGWESYPRDDVTRSWTKDKFAEKWSEELVADTLGLQLMRRFYDQPDDTPTAWEIELGFQGVGLLILTWHILEAYYYKHIAVPPFTNHPMAIMRLGMLIRVTQDPDKVWQPFTKMADEIIKRI